MGAARPGRSNECLDEDSAQSSSPRARRYSHMRQYRDLLTGTARVGLRRAGATPADAPHAPQVTSESRSDEVKQDCRSPYQRKTARDGEAHSTGSDHPSVVELVVRRPDEHRYGSFPDGESDRVGARDKCLVVPTHEAVPQPPEESSLQAFFMETRDLNKIRRGHRPDTRTTIHHLSLFGHFERTMAPPMPNPAAIG